jgi:hypothetical protein
MYERIARIGTMKDFIAWFDQTWNPDEAQQGEAACATELRRKPRDN